MKNPLFFAKDAVKNRRQELERQKAFAERTRLKRANRLAKATLPKELPPGRVFGYCRMSTAKQETSIEVQQKLIRGHYDAYLEPLGLVWGGFFCDPATSAKVKFPDRVAGGQLMKALARGDHLVVSKLDRAFRSNADCFTTIEYVRETGAFVHFLDVGAGTETMMGEILIAVMSMFAQVERRRISERTKEGLAARRAKGLADPAARRAFREAEIYHEKGRRRRRWRWLEYQLRVGLRCYQLYRNGETHVRIAEKMREAGVKYFNGKDFTWQYSHITVKRFKKAMSDPGFPEYARPADFSPAVVTRPSPSTATPSPAKPPPPGPTAAATP